MKRIYQGTGNITKRAVLHVYLERHGWTQNLTAAFERCKQAIVERMRMAHTDERKPLYAYTDAIDAT